MNYSVDPTALLLALFGGIFWLAGLSFQAKRNVDDIRELKNNHNNLGDEFKKDMKEFEATMRESLHRINSSLHRIEGGIWMKKQDNE